MKLSDDKFSKRREIKRGWTITRMITWVILFCGLIFAFVFIMNNKDAFVTNQTEASFPMDEISNESIEDMKEVTSDELDIWDKPEDPNATPFEGEPTGVEDILENEQDTLSTEDDVADIETEVPAGFFRITLENGDLETHKINTYLAESICEFENFNFNGIYTSYNSEDIENTYMGIKVSKEQGYIDFHKVKKDGIDFVMIAAGSRGYGTGQIVIDDYLSENLRNASDANLEIGLYFKSQAITEEEAMEEAMQILELVEGYQITYPIAFEMERIHSDEGRTESLERVYRTKVALAFLNTIKEAGYDTCIYGSSEFLIDYIDLSQLSSYDLWLDQEIKDPEIPYKFTMWEFSKAEDIEGVSGLVPVTISLIDYQAK